MPSKRQVILDWLIDPAGPLRGITVANGYVNTASMIERGQRDIDDLSEPDFPALFVAGTDEQRKNITSNQFSAELTVGIVGAVKSTTGVSGVQQVMDTFIADVTKALMTDHTQGGRVYSTNVGRIRTDQGNRFPHAICLVEVTFKYATEGTIP